MAAMCRLSHSHTLGCALQVQESPWCLLDDAAEDARLDLVSKLVILVSFILCGTACWQSTCQVLLLVPAVLDDAHDAR